MTAPFSIAILDDHHLFLQGFADYFSKLDIVRSVTTCSSYNQLLDFLSKEAPDILFLDLNLPVHSGFIICEHLKRSYPEIFIAILTQYDIHKYVQKARKCGADAYFVKNTDPEMLSSFLNCLAQNDINGFFAHVPTQDAYVLHDHETFELRELLTIRERQVLEMMINGLSHTEIEDQLGISCSTYKMHRTHIMQKLKIENEIVLGVFALKSGLRKS